MGDLISDTTASSGDTDNGRHAQSPSYNDLKETPIVFLFRRFFSGTILTITLSGKALSLNIKNVLRSLFSPWRLVVVLALAVLVYVSRRLVTI